MIEIISVSGSPVKDSSTDLLLKMLAGEIARRLEPLASRHEHWILNDMKIAPCHACGHKIPDDGYCILHDDMDSLYDRIEHCDCLLFGTPIYFDTVSAQAKLFIDRCNCVRPPDFKNEDPEHLFVKRWKRKRPGAMVLVGGENGWYEGARRTIAGFFKWIEIVSVGHIIYGSPDYNLKGTAVDSDEVEQQVDELSAKLALKIRESGAGR